MRRLLLSVVLVASFPIIAGDRIKMGITGDVSVEGFFSREIMRYELTKIRPNSPAEKAGLQVGDKLIAIGDCVIPGCPASEAREIMDKGAGESIVLLVEDKHGEQRTVEVLLFEWQS